MYLGTIGESRGDITGTADPVAGNFAVAPKDQGMGEITGTAGEFAVQLGRFLTPGGPAEGVYGVSPAHYLLILRSMDRLGMLKGSNPSDAITLIASSALQLERQRQLLTAYLSSDNRALKPSSRLDNLVLLIGLVRQHGLLPGSGVLSAILAAPRQSYKAYVPLAVCEAWNLVGRLFIATGLSTATLALLLAPGLLPPIANAVKSASLAQQSKGTVHSELSLILHGKF